MRALFLNHNVAWAGGTFYRAYHSARHLVRRGHSVHLLTISPKRRWGFHVEVKEGVEIVHTPDLLWGIARSGWDPWDALNRIRHLRGRQWDIVHAWDSRPVVILPALYARRQARGRGARLVIDWCDWFGRGGTQTERAGRLLNLAIGPVETFFEEAFRTGADGNTVISTTLYRRALALGVRPEAIMHLRQGSDVESIHPLDQSAARRFLRWPEAPRVIGHLGLLYPRDADFLFAAYDIIRDNLPDVRLFLIGRHRCDLDRYRAGADGWVETGPVSHEHLGQYLAACDLLLLPLADTLANRGRWPSRVNDYLAAGRPVVATAVGDVAALIKEYDVGAVTPPVAADFAATAIDWLQDRKRRDAAGRQARLLAETRLAWPMIARDLEEFYLRLG